MSPEDKGYQAEIEFDREAEYTFYVVSRRPGQTGGFSFGVGTITAQEPRPVYYSMVFEHSLQPNHKSIRPLPVKSDGRPIFVRVDATGFKPRLDTIRITASERSQITPQDAKEGPTWASSVISTLTPSSWEIVVQNNSAQAGTFRLTIDYPNVPKRRGGG